MKFYSHPMFAYMMTIESVTAETIDKQLPNTNNLLSNPQFQWQQIRTLTIQTSPMQYQLHNKLWRR